MSGTTAELAYGWLLIVVIAVLVWYCIRTYHERELVRIEAAELELTEFVKLALGKITFAWQCPHCGTPLLTREGLQVHQSSSSACAREVARLETALDHLEREPAGYSASAEVVPESATALADEEPAEIEA